LIRIAATVAALVQETAIETGRARHVSVVIGRPAMILHDHWCQEVHHARAAAIVAHT